MDYLRTVSMGVCTRRKHSRRISHLHLNLIALFFHSQLSCFVPLLDISIFWLFAHTVPAWPTLLKLFLTHQWTLRIPSSHYHPFALFLRSIRPIVHNQHYSIQLNHHLLHLIPSKSHNTRALSFFKTSKIPRTTNQTPLFSFQNLNCVRTSPTPFLKPLSPSVAAPKFSPHVRSTSAASATSATSSPRS